MGNDDFRIYPNKSTQKALDELGITNHPGYEGAFTRKTASGAWPSGARVKKTIEDRRGDFVPIGSKGTILGSVSNPKIINGMPAYFVEWDSYPKKAVLCLGIKLKLLSS